jgi:hypothetical protein
MTRLERFCRIACLSAMISGCHLFGEDSPGTDTPPEQQESLPPFDILITAPSLTGTTATRFTLQAELLGSLEPASHPSFTWDLGDGRPAVTASQIEAIYSTPGLYAVSVVARDEQGRTATNGVLLNVVAGAGRASFMGMTFGDVNSDQQINQLDLGMLRAYLRGEWRPQTSPQWVAADLDQDGSITSADVALLEQMLGEGKPWPLALTTTQGEPGARLTLLSPSLLDMAAEATITLVPVGHPSRMLAPFRVIPGYATFYLPTDIAGADPSAIQEQTLQVCLTTSKTGSECLSLHLVPGATLSQPPGERLSQALAEAASAMDTAQASLKAHLEATGTPEEAAEFQMAVAALAKEQVVSSTQQLAALFSHLDSETLRKMEQVALANGLPQGGLSKLRQPLVAAGDTCPSTGATLYNHAFVFKEVLLGVVEPTVELLGDVCSVLTVSSVVVPEVAPLALRCNVLSAKIGGAVSLMSAVAEFMPRLDETLRVTTSMSRLAVNDSTSISIEGGYTAIKDICEGSARLLTERLQESLIKKLARNIGAYRLAYYVIEALPLDERGGFRKSLIEQVNRMLRRPLVDATGMNQLVELAREKLCALLPPGEPYFEIPTCALTQFVMESSSGTVGTLKAGPGAGTYTAPAECVRETRIRVRAGYTLLLITASGHVDLDVVCTDRYSGSMRAVGVSVLNEGGASCVWNETWDMTIDLMTGKDSHATVRGLVQQVSVNECGLSGTSTTGFEIPLTVSGNSVSGISTPLGGCYKASLNGTFSGEAINGTLLIEINPTACPSSSGSSSGSFVLQM